MTLVLYFSGMESSWPDVKKIHDAKIEHAPKAVMVSYMHARGNTRVVDNLKEFRSKYNGMVMIDSGAYSFLNNDLAEQGKGNSAGLTSEGARQHVGKEDEYVHQYMDWLEQHRDAYDWAVELDIQKLVGQETVDKWREEFLARKIPLVIVMHRNAGDTIETVKKWKEKGCEYFGFGSGFREDDMGDKLFVQQMAEHGKVHIFGWTPISLFDWKAWVTSTDSTSWLHAGKEGIFFQTTGKKLVRKSDLRHNPLKMKQMLMSPVMQLWPQEERDRVIKERKFRILNYYNLVEIQKWVDNNNEAPGYQQALQMAGEGKAALPEWAGETDRLGRSKAIYLRSRFNAMKSGVYARELQKQALECNTCIVNDRCPVFEKDALCFFIKTWRQAGAKTRNQEQIVRTIENVIAEKFARYERARYMESKLGGATDSHVSNFENDLIKNLELLHRVKYGVVGQGMKVALNVNKEGVQLGVGTDMNSLLAEVRNEYGDRLVEKIKKRAIDVEAVEVADDGHQSMAPVDTQSNES
jgi:hypothetical protein